VKFFKKIIMLVLPLLIFGCAAFGLPVTSDPAKKIGQAYQLFDEQQRPLPAEKLIRDSIDIYKEKNDLAGLSEAYRAYGFFFRSGAIEKWNKHYKSKGFLETGATFENRYSYSIKYFKKARAIYLGNFRYDALANVYLNMGFTYAISKENMKACEMFDKSNANYEEHMKNHPDSKMNLPKGVVSYEDYIVEHKKRLSCE